MRLIDADSLQSEYKKYHDGKRSVLIDVASTIDAVPVIRCKDCKYAKCIEQNDDWWECSHDKRVMHGDGFCSWAERKEE